MARGINKVILIGNLGNDPDTRYSAQGSAITNISLATDESYKDRQTGQVVPRTEWHRVVLFNRLGEIAKEYLRKGSKVYVEGRLQTRKWQDQNGQDKYTTEIIANDLQMLDSRGGMEGGAPSPNYASSQSAPQDDGYGSRAQPQGGFGGASQGRPTHAGAHSQPAPMPEPIDDLDDDIPF